MINRVSISNGAGTNVRLIANVLLLCLVSWPAFLHAETTGTRQSSKEMVLIPGGAFQMGGDRFPDEGPVHKVTITTFSLDQHEVTVGQYAEFVSATGYRTLVEQDGSSRVFDVKKGEWTRRKGACWKNPDGNARKPTPDEPVTQVTWEDATAFAKWAKKRLPTEAEYEFASRGGLDGEPYPWGHELTPGKRHKVNIWQGEFPKINKAADGFSGVAPTGRFPANGYGLHDISGNVWEWCADWYVKDYYSRSPETDPQGPPDGEDRVTRGGSFLCSEKYCQGYRCAARSCVNPITASNTVGFRCARDCRIADSVVP